MKTSLIKPAQDLRQVRGSAVLLLFGGLGLKGRPDLQHVLQTRFAYNANNPPVSYPYERYLEIAEYLRQTFYGSKTPEEGYEELGYRLTQSYFQGVSGQVLRVLARVLGPERGARQFLHMMSNNLPWGRHELQEVSSNSARYCKSGVGGPPALMLGILRASLEASGATLVRATYSVISESDDEVVYAVEWL